MNASLRAAFRTGAPTTAVRFLSSQVKEGVAEAAPRYERYCHRRGTRWGGKRLCLVHMELPLTGLLVVACWPWLLGRWRGHRSGWWPGSGKRCGALLVWCVQLPRALPPPPPQRPPSRLLQHWPLTYSYDTSVWRCCTWCHCVISCRPPLYCILRKTLCEKYMLQVLVAIVSTGRKREPRCWARAQLPHTLDRL